MVKIKHVKMVTVPASYFTAPLAKSIAKSIAAPTALTRRKEMVVSAPLPLELFEELMAPLMEGDAEGLVREGGSLKPTKSTSATHRWVYVVKRGSVSNRLFCLEQSNPKQKASSTAQRARGVGCARVRLSVAEQRRGGLPQTMSMVAGNVLIQYVLPRQQLRPPVLTLTFGVLTMDNKGHIIWPKDFDAASAAQLRNQARALLQNMIADPRNPAGSSMVGALTGVGGSLRATPPRRHMVVVPPQ